MRIGSCYCCCRYLQLKCILSIRMNEFWNLPNWSARDCSYLLYPTICTQFSLMWIRHPRNCRGFDGMNLRVAVGNLIWHKALNRTTTSKAYKDIAGCVHGWISMMRVCYPELKGAYAAWVITRLVIYISWKFSDTSFVNVVFRGYLDTPRIIIMILIYSHHLQIFTNTD